MVRRVLNGIAVLGVTAGLVGGGAALASAATGGSATTTTPTTPNAAPQQQSPNHHCHHPGSAGTGTSSGTSPNGAAPLT
jgi:hypothetical protein